MGDDLPGEEASRIEDHLESCALCSAEYASFASAREALVSLREEMPRSGSLWAGIARGIGSDGAEVVAHAAFVGAGRPRRQPRWAAWTGLAAAAVLAVAFLPRFFRPDEVLSPSDATGEMSANAPMIEQTTPEELRNFMLRTGQREVPVEESLPLATPAAARPDRDSKVYF